LKRDRGAGTGTQGKGRAFLGRVTTALSFRALKRDRIRKEEKDKKRLVKALCHAEKCKRLQGDLLPIGKEQRAGVDGEKKLGGKGRREL